MLIKRQGLTRDTWVLVVGCEFGFRGVSSWVYGVGVVDTDDLTTLESDCAIKAQRLNDTSIWGYKKLGSLHEASDGNAIDVVTRILRFVSAPKGRMEVVFRFTETSLPV
jgi:hypothetical protein